ncbi:UNKNOWN [Stylonychia lemnae]|uniref:Uncharacterized protein n=1 Tax=Stylonychia lemnae TaxID=5949 RepID=A0A078B4Y6_STYLE|nr:UNKNOWN [Stylonychia lemnae]|eukprot:CDW89590.1 UNKNOWN [Stylonychia lemnae]
MDDSIDSIYISVDLVPKICYIEEENSEEAAQNSTLQKLRQDAVDCALSDYPKCRNNNIDQCKFIDCFTTNVKKPSADKDKDYLFSACIPKQLVDDDITNVCYQVAHGNYYIDYFTNDDGTVLDDWGGKTMHTFLIAIIIISSFLCCICSLSCFYNYRVFRRHDPPFPVPRFCPDCLFPQRDYREMLRQQQDQALEDSMNDNSVNDNQQYQVISAFNIEEPTTKKDNNDEVPEPTDTGNINAKPKYDKYKLPQLSF